MRNRPDKDRWLLGGGGEKVSLPRVQTRCWESR